MADQVTKTARSIVKSWADRGLARGTAVIVINEFAQAIRAAERAMCERAAVAIRAECLVCDDGHNPDDPTGMTECEYCGSPIAVLRKLADG